MPAVFPKGVPAGIFGSSLRLKQTLAHPLGPAIKFTEQGKPRRCGWPRSSMRAGFGGVLPAGWRACQGPKARKMNTAPPPTRGAWLTAPPCASAGPRLLASTQPAAATLLAARGVRPPETVKGARRLFGCQAGAAIQHAQDSHLPLHSGLDPQALGRQHSGGHCPAAPPASAAAVRGRRAAAQARRSASMPPGVLRQARRPPAGPDPTVRDAAETAQHRPASAGSNRR